MFSVRYALRPKQATRWQHCDGRGQRNSCHGGDSVYEGCPENIWPFWISREPVVWPWCNLASSLRRPYCASVNSHSPVGLVVQRWDAMLVYCVTFAFTITEWADQLHRDNAPAHSTALVQAFLAKHHITQVCQPPYSPDLALCNFWLFPKLKLPLKGRGFVNAMVTQYTSSFNSISLPAETSPMGEWLFMDAQ
jgi:hypothetical protein